MRFRIPAGKQIRRHYPFLLIAIGAALIIYVAAQYWTMYSEQRQLVRAWKTEQQNPAAVSAKHRLTMLSIPKISLEAVVVEGTTRRALLRGPGHIKETPQPGEAGNAVITGHRDTFFRHIYELDRGDTVNVVRDGREYRYEVTGKKVVKPTDVSVLKPTSDSRLTLITCYPTYFIGPAPERLVVFTKLSDDRHAELNKTQQDLKNESARR